MKTLRFKHCAAISFLLILGGGQSHAQDFTQRGFLETRYVLYPEKALNDRGRSVGEALLRYEATKQYFKGLRFNGAFDARTDTHRQVEREAFLNYSDRRPLRPAFSIRRASMSYTRGVATFEIGKQFIRWGKADILNPTDRFAPRDFLTVFDNEFLPVTAARATFDNGKDSLDLVWQARFTPSRTPLLNQRWTVFPPGVAAAQIVDLGPQIPGGSQYGVRYNHIGRGFEGSLSFYDGANHLPIIDGRLLPATTPMPSPDSLPSIGIHRVFPKLRSYGADFALPSRLVTLKGEAAYFESKDLRADSYVLYVIQLERQIGEVSLVGGYAGEELITKRSPFNFAPDRGIAKAYLGRVAYTIDVNSSIAVETAAHANGDGLWLRLEYTRAWGQHWRATFGGTLIRGERGDFIGQYQRNSNVSLAIRYSF